MKTMKLINESTRANLKLNDDLSIKLAQTRALLLVGSDADFSEYPLHVQQDFLGLALECIETMGDAIKEM